MFDGITGTDKTAFGDEASGRWIRSDCRFLKADGKPDIALVSSKMDDQNVSIIDYQANRLILASTCTERLGRRPHHR